DASPVLWALGLVTALLTAFYMSRQVFLVFFGEERFRQPAAVEAAAAADADAAAEAEAADATTDAPEPVHEPHESPWLMTVPNVEVKSGSKGHTALIAAAPGLDGVAAAVAVDPQKRAKVVEPEVQANGLYSDATRAVSMGSPGRATFQELADFDKEVIDGAVN